ncbi:hypothetical protein N7493_004145 [Penicillium malachiteum]|uniref:Alpha/beta-hydrolase n=1 Tax=Penicillium malachiteum TaxID=1324776 RepID=A0AAD6MYG8_9EURO|nr:hypothetical protein N7493_004145 [Penicillium malachiteum]
MWMLVSADDSTLEEEIGYTPKVSDEDAPDSIEENSLRSAIFIPSEFKFGHDGKTPVILVPATGTYGGEAFEPNFAKLLKASTFEDPVWLNIPGRMCDKAPKNAQYVAYAINYISSRAQKSVAVVDFAGTINAWGLVPFSGTQPGTPAVWHQTRNASFIAMLRSNGGDSAYVPTTSIYSATDEVVQALAAWALKNILLFMPKPWHEPALPLFVSQEKKTYVPEPVDETAPKTAVAVSAVEMTA